MDPVKTPWSRGEASQWSQGIPLFTSRFCAPECLRQDHVLEGLNQGLTTLTFFAASFGVDSIGHFVWLPLIAPQAIYGAFDEAGGP